MTLNDLYEFHDSVEKFLRAGKRETLPGQIALVNRTWELHDLLERVTIEEQSKLTEEEIE